MPAINKENYYYDTDVALTDRVNSSTDVNKPNTTTSALETRYSNSGKGVVAKVLINSGTYLKVKWLKGGKKVGSYKSRKTVNDDVETALEHQMNKNPLVAASAANTVAVTGTNTITHPGTSQFTLTLTRADLSTEDVTSKATWSSATPAKATVNANTGLVTSVASGTSVITGTYAGKSNTRTMTVS